MLQDHFGAVTIQTIPPLRVARYRAVSAEPEHDSISFMEDWIERHGWKRDGMRSFGMDVEVSAEQSSQGMRGYEAWKSVPPEAIEVDGVSIQDFGGGEYAVMRLLDPFTNAYEVIPGGWKFLHEWVLASPDHMSGGHQWLEENIATPDGVCLDLCHPIQPRAVQTSIPQQVRLVEIPAMRLTGLRYEGSNANGEIPRLWDEQFLLRFREVVGNAETFNLYGVARDLPGSEPGVFEYLAAGETHSEDAIPKGMITWDVPGGLTAVLAADNVPNLGPVNEYFLQRWLPEHNWHLESNGCYLLEVYPPEFSSNGIIYLHFPVKRK